MISFICGEIVSICDNSVVIKNDGIGYELIVSDYTASKCVEGDNVQLFTYLQVKEDAFVLYGFSSVDEKNMFLQLITVSGIGCKVAISILSGMQINDLGLAILNADTSALRAIKGLGKKTAERIILELREKMTAFEGQKPSQEAIPNINMEEAISILRTLGLSRGDAVSKAQLAVNSGAVTTEEILNYALRNY